MLCRMDVLTESTPLTTFEVTAIGMAARVWPIRVAAEAARAATLGEATASADDEGGAEEEEEAA